MKETLRTDFVIQNFLTQLPIFPEHKVFETSFRHHADPKTNMDEFEFHRLLQLFPVVRSRDYHAESELSRQSTSKSFKSELNEWQEAWNEDGEKPKDQESKPKDQGSDRHDGFWEKLMLAAEQKVGKVEAERFCNSFQQIHNKLVNEELSLDAARSFLDSFSCSSTEE